MMVLQFNTTAWKFPLAISACSGCVSFTGTLTSKLVCDEVYDLSAELTTDVCDLNYHILEVQTVDPYVRPCGDYEMVIFCSGQRIYSEDVRFNYEELCPHP